MFDEMCERGATKGLVYEDICVSTEIFYFLAHTCIARNHYRAVGRGDSVRNRIWYWFMVHGHRFHHDCAICRSPHFCRGECSGKLSSIKHHFA